MTAASGKLIKGQTGDWEMVIGLEVHAQVCLLYTSPSPRDS